jgi:DNA-binding transcriptional ArsR family regulator
MKDGPNIAVVAALIGDSARADILSSLMDGRSLTVGELAPSADISLPTASTHVSKLEGAGLLVSVRQGRNRYVRLSGADVVHTLESLMLLAERTGHRRVRTGPREPALREARTCYDHLGGARGIQLLESLAKHAFIERKETGLFLSGAGEKFVCDFGIDPEAAGMGKGMGCVTCLDWSERKDHLAGWLGAAFLARILCLKWARRDKSSRAVLFTANGLREFDRLFPV